METRGFFENPVLKTVEEIMTKTTILPDIEIARRASQQSIVAIAAQLGLDENDLELYGKRKAKVSLDVWERIKDHPDGRLILVTSINPTPAGEGKSTVTVGLGQALNRLGHRATVAIREPSLGPSMGIKGGAAGGGYAQVVPMEEINLHFTGDLHAITSAHNAIAALLDNHLHQGNQLGIDPRQIIWKRVMDLNDRALRRVVIGLGGPAHGMPREDGFDITVASELMAVLCLAQDLTDLKERIGRIVVGYRFDKRPVTVADLGAEGAATLLLKDALAPNLVQTLENTPAFVHGGPFANIAHGCSSLIATRFSLKLSEYTVTEAGFGADLGAEKFLHIKSRSGGLTPDVAIVVATVRALKMHGGVKREALDQANPAALTQGISNLAKHLDTLDRFGVPYIVALNRFVTDTEEELKVVRNWCAERKIPFALSEVWENGGKGGEALAKEVVRITSSPKKDLHLLYGTKQPIKEKISAIAREVYGAADVTYSPSAERQIVACERHGWDELPICMAKTQYSLSDDPSLLGRPEGFTLHVREIRPRIGAGFLVVLTGDVLTMPGLPKQPAALKMDVDSEGRVSGLF